MKKGLLVIFAFLVLSVLAATAFTSPDKPNKDERSILSDTFAFPGEGYRIGIVLSELGERERKELKVDSGVVVADVLPDSPAKKAGIEEGDVILRVDGNEVTSQKELRRMLQKLEEPKAISVELLRDGKNITLSVTPEKRGTSLMRHFGGNYIGVQLQDLDADLAEYFHTKPQQGVLVARVESDSPAQKAGLRSGDVITRLNGKNVSDPESLREQLSSLEENETAEIVVLRHGKESKYTVKPERRNLQEFRNLRELRELPEMKQLRELPEFEGSMDELKSEMEKLKTEMKKLKVEDLKAMREEIQKQLESVRKELDKLKNSD